MRLVHADYHLSIEFHENRLETLVVESPSAYAEILAQLCLQFEGESGGFILSDSDTALSFSKTSDLIIDPFHIDLNNRRFLNKLYSELGDVASQALISPADINSQVVQLLDEILEKTMYTGIVYDLDLSWEDLFRSYHVRLDDRFDSLLEKVVEYLKIMVSLFDIKLFVFCGLHGFLSSEEIAALFQQMQYLKTNLLLLESSEYEKTADEQVHILDRDLCIITK